MIYFISGHLDLTEDEFIEHYEPKIVEAAGKNAEFVVGDARGADTMAQCLLSTFKKNFLSYSNLKVTVYHILENPRNNVGEFPTVEGHASQEKKDAAMTKASNADIAWVRPGRQKSGTARNLERRKKMALWA